MRLRALAFLALASLLTTAASTVGPARAGSAHHRLFAIVRRTTGGVPHILAYNWPSLGFGYGYAFAQDNLCTMANDYVTVEGQRSRYFGPGATYIQRGNGTVTTNLGSDLFFRQIIDAHIVDRLVAARPPDGPVPQVKQMIAGYVAGYNRYLADVGGTDGVSDPVCRGKPWVKPITVRDAYLRIYQIVLLNGEDPLIDAIATAAPPSPASSQNGPPRLRSTARRLMVGWHADSSSLGSNAVAIGSAGTRDHTHGLLLGNPHFPWLGTERFYQAQLTIPGQINVTGASLFGFPLIQIGNTATMAWSHTVSTAFTFTTYQLALVAGHPTEYLEDGHPVAMTSRKVTVTVRQPDGMLTQVSRTLWSTRYGPVITSLFGVPMPWSAGSAFAVRDANAANMRILNHFFDTDRATSTLQELAILKRYEALPWVNTIVADKNGSALYADIGAIPNVSNAKAHACDTPLGAVTFQEFGLPILDGSRMACDLADAADAAAPGIFGPSHEPYLLRRDYVANSNDSYWLSNAHQPLTGFARIIGDEGTERNLRTRIGIIQVQARIHGNDGLGPAGFTLRDMENMDLSDLDYAAVLTRGDLVHLCLQFQAAGGKAPTSTGGSVALGDSCAILAKWDLKDDITQAGAVLFRTFWSYALAVEPSEYRHPFSLSDPVHTPYGLNTANKNVHDALGDAIAQLNSEHVPLNATVGSVQYVAYRGTHIPIPGGPNGSIYNSIYTGEYPVDSVTAPDDGSSFIQVVTWDNTRCPVGATILTYSESSNPVSPHHADQTALFSKKEWIPNRFCESQIASDPNLRTTIVSG